MQYANYAKRRAEDQSVVIIQVAIPNFAIEGLSDNERFHVYSPSQEWKELVFYSRRGDPYPRNLAKFMNAVLIIGTICSKPSHIFGRLDTPDAISDQWVLKNKDSRPAIQYVWPRQTGEEFFKLHATQRLRVFPLTAAEHGRWEEQARYLME